MLSEQFKHLPQSISFQQAFLTDRIWPKKNSEYTRDDGKFEKQIFVETAIMLKLFSHSKKQVSLSDRKNTQS